MRTTKFDAVDQAVIAQGLIAAAREMGSKLIRSATAPVVREAAERAAAEETAGAT